MAGMKGQVIGTKVLLVLKAVEAAVNISGLSSNVVNWSTSAVAKVTAQFCRMAVTASPQNTAPCLFLPS